MHGHAAFADCRHVVPLSGFSGALIALVELSSGERCVRKVAGKPADGAKLRHQAKRQVALDALLGGVARMPAVLRDGEADGCYWFDMAFAPGTDAVSYLGNAPVGDVERFIDRIGATLERLSGCTEDAPAIDLGAQVTAKLSEIAARTEGRDSALIAPLVPLAGALKVMLQPSAAHGDLTLENIIVDRTGALWLIDTIDSPFAHYWNDLAKLFQDIEGRWFLHRGRSLSLGLSWVVRQRLLAVGAALDPRYPACHHLMLALTFARILPYCSTAGDHAFVSSRVAEFADLATRSMEKMP